MDLTGKDSFLPEEPETNCKVIRPADRIAGQSEWSPPDSVVGGMKALGAKLTARYPDEWAAPRWGHPGIRTPRYVRGSPPGRRHIV